MPEPRELIGQCLERAKAVQASCQAAGLAQAADELMQVREALLEIREGWGTREDILRAQRDRIAELEAALNLRPQLVRHMGVYWIKGDGDPWCPNCWETAQRACHLNPTAVLSGRLYVCQRCNYDVNIDHVHPPKWP